MNKETLKQGWIAATARFDMETDIDMTLNEKIQ
jgi:hypothetical protein